VVSTLPPYEAVPVATDQRAFNKRSSNGHGRAQPMDAPPEPSAVQRPLWRSVLRALREARGVTQEGWATLLGYSEPTVRRWERGSAVPTADAEAAIVAVCRERGLFRTYTRGPLAGLTLTPELLRDLLAQARIGGALEPPAVRGQPEAPPVPSGSRERVLLPIPLTSFIGRERELAAVGVLLAQGRLLTLTGPGGVGKTRLATEVARGVAHNFPDGIWFAELAPVGEPALVPQAVATLLGVRDGAERSLTESIVAALGERAALLVLDNCEHLVGACAALASALLAACPRLAVLATSREPLHLRGEQLYPLPPLPLPPEAAPSDAAAAPRELGAAASVRLFVERARAVRPDFAPDAAALDSVSAICRRLDGLPLAIEMAAAQVRVLSPEQIVARLTGSLPTVAASARDEEPRHRTLRALIDWSYSLLEEPERALFRRLAVFAGGGDLEAVEAVCAVDDLPPEAVLGSLTALVDKSLVVAEVQPPAARYRFLESIREYAAEQLATSAEAAAVQQRHAAYFLQLARTARRSVTGPRQAEAVRRLEQEHHNLRAALAWSLDGGDAETALRLCAALVMFWWIRGHLREGRTWVARALAAASPGASRARATALHGAAALAYTERDYADGLGLITESVALWRLVGDPRGLAASLAALGQHAWQQGNLALARQACAEALALFAEAPDPWGERQALSVLGWTAEFDGDHAEARRWLERSLAVARAADSPVDVAWQLNDLGLLALRRGVVREADARYREALRLARDVGATSILADSLEGLAGVAAARGHPRRAAWLTGAAGAVRTAIAAPRSALLEEEYGRLVTVLHAALGERGLAEASAEGAAVPLAEVIADALATTDGGNGGPEARADAARGE
jgi:non-specific serine/threonine protein kinase